MSGLLIKPSSSRNVAPSGQPGPRAGAAWTPPPPSRPSPLLSFFFIIAALCFIWRQDAAVSCGGALSLRVKVVPRPAGPDVALSNPRPAGSITDSVCVCVCVCGGGGGLLRNMDRTKLCGGGGGGRSGAPKDAPKGHELTNGSW